MSVIRFIAVPALIVVVGCSTAPDAEVGRAPAPVERDEPDEQDVTEVDQPADAGSAPADESSTAPPSEATATALSPAARAMARRESLAVERGEPTVEDWRCFSVINMFGPCCSKHGEQDPDLGLVD